MNMMKTFSICAAALMLAGGLKADISAPVKPIKSFVFTPDMAEAKAGDKIKSTIKIVAADGFVIDGFDVKILRKDAPKEFFTIPQLPYNKHKNSNYDNFTIKEYTRIPGRPTTAEVPLEIDTAGYKAGDYVIIAVGSYFDKNNKRHYAGGCFFLTLTTSDNSGVIPGAATMPEVVTIKPAKMEIAANTPLLPITVDFKLKPGKTVKLYSCFITRSRAPESFFAANADKVIKNAGNPQNDRIELQGNRKPTGSGNQGTVTINSKPLKFTPGTYRFIVQLYGYDKNGKAFYNAKILQVNVK